MAFGPARPDKPLEMNARVRMLLVAITAAVVLMLIVLALLSERAAQLPAGILSP